MIKGKGFWIFMVQLVDGSCGKVVAIEQYFSGLSTLSFRGDVGTGGSCVEVM